MIFECFEASPQIEAVMSCATSLLCTFPAHAVSIPISAFHNPQFRAEIASMLEKLDAELIDEAQLDVKNASSKISEIWDTAHPRLVTEMFMASLSAVGQPSKVRQIQKRSRDDVLWNECRFPWRRSPLWLTMRVAIQTTLTHMIPDDEVRARTLYKDFMAFIMTEIASLAFGANLPGDMCLVINAKIARRIFKLGADVTSLVRDGALSISRTTRKEYEKIWSAVQFQDSERAVTVDGNFSFISDTSLTLDNSRGYLESVLAVDHVEARRAGAFAPQCKVWISKTNRGLPHADCFDFTGEELVYMLADVESWISDSLARWVSEAIANPQDEDCLAIASLAKEYYCRASAAYKSVPEQNSTMILTLAELWKAIDLLATTLIPLLKDFIPEVRPEFLNLTLLPQREQMQRLAKIEEHIVGRIQRAKTQNPSVFSDQRELSFAVQFSKSSQEHKGLRSRIEKQASEAVEAKKKEHREKEAEYYQMQQQTRALTCQVNDDDGIERHDPECTKCELERLTGEMSIDVYEWPLPSDEAACVSTIFELDCPTSFAAWRSVTWIILNDLGRPPAVSLDNPAAILHEYTGLKDYATQKSRLTFASKKRSLTKTQHRELRFPVSVDRCMVPNALKYEYFDLEKRLWVRGQTLTPSIDRLCKTALPEGPYSNLQYSVDSTLHGQNRVIAEQETCHKDLTLHEFIAFGSLRADGERMQWLNIKRELAASNLNLKTEAVCTLMTQAAWQAGSKDAGKSKHYKLRSGGNLDEGQEGAVSGTTVDQRSLLRMSHVMFLNTEFCKELLSIISGNLESIGANWHSDHTLLLLVVITLRTLSLSTERIVIRTAMTILHQIRGVAEKWTHELTEMLHKVNDEEQRTKARCRILKAAILCKMTYSVDREYISDVMGTSEDLRCWVICSIRLQENTPADDSTLLPELRRLLLRDRRLSHFLHRRVQQLTVDEGNTGLNMAIEQVLSGFEPSVTPWTSLAYPLDRWIHVRTQASAVHSSQEIYYNVLEGDLIIDGMPLGKLPVEYLRSNMYRKIFGAQILHVLSADLPGMEFMTSREVSQYKVYFGMRDGSLVIRTRKGEEMLELVPESHFEGDLPAEFVNEYTLWLDLSSRVIEFRPLHQIWTSSQNNWRLSYQPDANSHLSKGERRLVDVRSNTCLAAFEIFKSLEMMKFVHVMLFQEVRLEVYLPRLKMTFFKNEAGDMECRELRRIVDRDQSLRTLIGLKSRLVLCGLGDLAKKHDRVVIVPFGEPLVTKAEAHVEVKISTNNRAVSFFIYRYDMELGRLCGDGKMSGALFKAYLHALTSYIYPDPFTGHTGTDEALICIQEQLTRCSEPLDKESMKLVTLISALTPSRKYYPENLKVMQRVKWNPTLSPLGQHDDFFYLAEQIIRLANRSTIFYQNSKKQLFKSPSDQELMQRARKRNSTYRSPDSGGNILARDGDVEYGVRDRSMKIEKAEKVYEIASIIDEWPSKLDVSTDISGDLLDLGTISGFGTKYSISTPISELLRLSFASAWGPLQQLCRSSPQNSKYSLLFLFSVIAYGQTSACLTTLRTLLAFAFVPDLGDLKVPPYSSFALDLGCAPTENALQEIIKSHEIPFKAQRGLSVTERRQQKKIHNGRSEKQIEALVRHYNHQWPRSKPATPPSWPATLTDMRGAHSKISDLFLKCTKNVEFAAYMQKVQVILKDIQLVFEWPKELPTLWQSSERIPVQLGDHVCRFPTIKALMVEEPPESMPLTDVLTAKRSSFQAARNTDLHSMVLSLRSSGGNLGQTPTRRMYGDDLIASLDAYQNHLEKLTPSTVPCSVTRTSFYREMVRHHVDELSKQLREILSPKHQVLQLLELAGVWPKLTLRALLKLLSKTSAYTISTPWQHCLIALGEAVTILQRARRLVLAGERLEVSTFFDEIENVGRQGWNSFEFPDWLLIEIENDFLIRPMQARVALEMVQPSSSVNSLIQLNMGEGKSSVIIPLVAVALADGRRLVRIIVLKSLTKQMSQLITQRLGGLVSRQIYYMPFSRSTVVDENIVGQIQRLQKECMKSKGVLLAQPEHVLSYKLMGIEKLASGHYKLASRLLASQKWLAEKSRDILDESDEILDVRFQLIYTLGIQRMMDGQPDRWQIIQEVLALVDKHASTLQKTTQDDIELERRSPSSFPTIRLLSSSTGDYLMSMLAHDIVGGQLPALNLTRCSANVKEAISRFIQDYHVMEADCLKIKDSFVNEPTMMRKLFLIRGLIAYKILLFVLRGKRWSVNYGLHPSRCLSAVPYRAKGVPAPSAEFGHPDVAIALTCLTYYYSGLTDTQIRSCLELLQKSDDPTAEYATWVSGCTSLPVHLRNWSAINLEDDNQCHEEVFPAIRFSKKLADYFLNSFVFPQEGKQFDEKLSTSGWDIPSRPGAENISTGFSGTNDNRFLLPLTISQQDMPDLHHTSGKVLDYVTRPENRCYYFARDKNGQQMSAENLLRYISNVEPEIRVLIDVGAQVLDKCNQDVVKDWMQLIPDVDAGVYFDEEDNIMVLPRNLEAESLVTSSFQGRMDRCVVYLDEVHTRGTDLKLPKDARAALTLGPRLTKDKLVQGM